MYVNLMDKRIAFYTLGCKVNQYESDSMMDMLRACGAVIVPFEKEADVYVINTCSVTNMADRKSRQIIHRARKNNQNGIVVACGCYVQAARDELVNDNSVDLVIGNNRKKDIARILDEYFEDRNKVSDNYIDVNATTEYESMTLVKPSEHTRAYVKVQDGCNNFCTYCIIPYTRGRIRSRELSEVVEEVTGLAGQGIKEVVVTGINLSSYNDSKGNRLTELLMAISNIDGILRIRMGSLEPGIITGEFLMNISSRPKICPHFHLSLQSACNDTLKRMNRKYTIEEYMEKCELIRACFDRPAITTDVIVGFPGETDEEFDITVSNLKKLNLYEMHIFKYSRRNGTIAADMPNQVKDEIKEKRSSCLLDMTRKQKQEYEESFKGENVDILVEKWEKAGDKYYIKGHTDRYMLISSPIDEAEKENLVNKIVTVRAV